MFALTKSLRALVGTVSVQERFALLHTMAMRAVRVDQLGGAENMKVLKDVPIPKPAENEVLVKLQAAGINPVDTYIRQGNYGQIDLPYTPGKDGAGIVEQVGAAVKKFKKGDRVMVIYGVTGTYAEYCTAKETFLCPLHDSLSFEQGASVGIPYYTAFDAIHLKAKAQKGETVLVHGASGAVGIAAVQILKTQGCHVIGTAGTPEGLQLVKNQGAEFVFNHREENYMSRIMKEVTNGKGVDVILEMLANVNLQADLETLAFRGRVVVIGCRGSIEINPRLLMKNQSMIMGVLLGASPESEFEPIHAAIEAGQAAGWLKPIVGKVYPMEDVRKGHHDVINNSGTQGKLILNVSS